MDTRIFDIKLGPLKSFISAVETLRKKELFTFFEKGVNVAFMDSMAADFKCFDTKLFKKLPCWKKASPDMLLFKKIYLGAIDDFVKRDATAFKIKGTRTPIETHQDGSSVFLVELVFSHKNNKLVLRRRYLKTQTLDCITVTPQDRLDYVINDRQINTNDLITNDIDAFAIEAISEGGFMDEPTDEEVKEAQRLYDLNTRFVDYLTRNKKDY